MAYESGENVQRLRDAGLFKVDELPEEYAELFANLPPGHVKALIEVRQRIVEIEEKGGPPADECAFPP